MKIATGIFCWTSTERRTARYGFAYAGDKNYLGDVDVKPKYDMAAINKLVGSRVRLTCTVLKNRKSGHCGDKFLELVPSKPSIGDVITVAVGRFAVLEDNTSFNGVTFGVQPDDGRPVLWMDPKAFFRLHDQTVEFHAVPVGDDVEDFSPDAEMLKKALVDEKIILDSDSQGTFFQIRARTDPDAARIAMPNVTSLGDGMLAVDFGQKGVPYDTEKAR